MTEKTPIEILEEGRDAALEAAQDIRDTNRAELDEADRLRREIAEWEQRADTISQAIEDLRTAEVLRTEQTVVEPKAPPKRATRDARHAGAGVGQGGRVGDTDYG